MNKIEADTAPKSDTDTIEADSPGDSTQEMIANDSEVSWLSRIFGKKRSTKASIREDLNEALTNQNSSAGDFTPEEKLMLHNILRLQDAKVEDLMIARAEIEAVELSTTLGELLVLFESSGHSRMPVFDDTLDDPKGMIHIRDVVGFITRTSSNGRKRAKHNFKSLDLTKVDLTRDIGKLNLVRPVIFTPPSMLAADLMAKMQASRIQMALVIDEYGGTEGLISLEDIVELIVGDIEDEHDDDEELIVIDEQGTIKLDARAELEDIREAVGGNFHVGEHDEDAETIGGVIFSLLGRIPVKGEVIDAFGYEFRIQDADPRRIKMIEMVVSKKQSSRKLKPGE